MTKKLLLIAQDWPAPETSAIGRRLLELLKLMNSQGYQSYVACAAELRETTPIFFIRSPIALNHSSFDHWVKKLSPQVVIYDRFIAEEQYGWRVRQSCPTAISVLDTSDLHCLRQARQLSLQVGQSLRLHTATAQRELAAILRCDLSLLIADFEKSLLENHFNMSSHLLLWLPFLVADNDWQEGPVFKQREHCLFMGNFKHKPNRDAAMWLANELWPIIRTRLPNNCELHLYGSFVDHAIQALHNPKNRFFVKGKAANAHETVGRYRLNLAPLRFGAGQKAKILQGWQSGTPTIASPTGFESMANENQLGFKIPTNAAQWRNCCADLYHNQDRWRRVQTNGFEILQANFLADTFAPRFTARIEEIAKDLTAHRDNNFFGSMLWQQQFRAQEFMGRWIEEKNRMRESPGTDS